MLRSQLLVALGLARLLATVLPKVYWPVLLHGEDEEEGRAKSVPFEVTELVDNCGLSEPLDPMGWGVRGKECASGQS